jgi:hypothetical protein
MSTSALLTLSDDGLTDRAEQLRAQIVTSGAAILDVVVKDLDKYLQREAKRRFLEHVEFASAMDTARLQAFRGALRKLSGDLEGVLRADLTASDIWLAEELPEDRKSMRGNPPVWAVLQKIACQLAGLFAAYDFPPDVPGVSPDYQLEYDTPRYFIEHLYCPGLIEAYWKQNEELAVVRTTETSRARALSQEELEARWNALD